MRFGVFIAPYHMIGDNPTLALERDIELVEAVEELGFEEAWFGEHHSGGTEIIASPELMIATAAAKTKRIRLGTGVASLPYHHPFMFADRMVQLDHLTRGRLIVGVGPGALPGDAYMMGIETTRQREMMLESLDVVMRLWRDEGPVSVETDWFTLRDARLQLRPYSKPNIEVSVAVTASPSGPVAAGRFGVGLLSIAATQRKAFDALARNWRTAVESAEANGNTVSRDTWRLCGPMHIAETEEQARRDVEKGLTQWVDYFQNVGAIPILGDFDPGEDIVSAVNETGVGVIGTPEMAVEQLRRLREKSGGFGTYLLMAHEWANREATLRSYELISRYVMPHFQDSLEPLERSRDWTVFHREQLMGNIYSAIAGETQKFLDQRDARRRAEAEALHATK
ncbi:LLM class flavin-dependent oxidoreductase [Mycolicibacterium sp. S2-37]|uniref:LLM class flavin-dependent oxidoreductase n=1 Tax=Mycolicibacterium sp. S2-37 TaxID=2810297 RepID=UPI001A947548|nr:LLM class flavin-dependent oxidoreductase [Mycolicibacterium sp. S2-37]MBO0676613.1 LLM class flavin-dependent oxidoreductase [Mycolicibacterium sp. S2-37]